MIRMTKHRFAKATRTGQASDSIKNGGYASVPTSKCRIHPSTLAPVRNLKTVDPQLHPNPHLCPVRTGCCLARWARVRCAPAPWSTRRATTAAAASSRSGPSAPTPPRRRPASKRSGSCQRTTRTSTWTRWESADSLLCCSALRVRPSWFGDISARNLPKDSNSKFLNNASVTCKACSSSFLIGCPIVFKWQCGLVEDDAEYFEVGKPKLLVSRLLFLLR
jgi:hypothetical protein